MWTENLLKDGTHATRLRNDFPYFCEQVLRIRTKDGPLMPFKLNAAQLKLHALAEEQLAKTGRVRIVVLKARQLGCSTLIAARLFHKTIFSTGLRTFILGHERRASSNLFEIVRRFHEHLPPDIKPETATSNAESLVFAKLDSGYIVSVAAGEGVGRSATCQQLHCSEVAFWDDLPSQFAALMQIVPDADGSEIWVESTARGFNDFYQLWRRAEAGQSEFTPIFLPWSVDPEYSRVVSPDFTMDADEKRLAELHNLLPEQISWRRSKISQLSSIDLFDQEYPIDPQSAFISSNFDSFIPPTAVIAARRERVEPFGQLIIGCDPAVGVGADKTAIVWRRGSTILKVEKRDTDPMQTVAWIADIIKTEKPIRVNVDSGSLGIAIINRLHELGHSRSLINPVAFGGKPVTPNALDEMGREVRTYANRRAEIWAAMKKALTEGRFQLPDNDALQGDLTSVGYSFRSDGALLLESKSDMARRGVPSPDLADACALCFCEGDGFVRDKNFRRDLTKLYKGIRF